MKNLIISLVLLTIVGCTYSVYSSGLPHLKTISIEEFENETEQYELEVSLIESLSREFMRDGRLRLVDLEPDCLLEGKILDYSNKLATYGSTGIDEYEVRILYAVTFTDLVENKEIYKSSSLVLTKIYSNSETAEIKSEEDAISEIEQDLFERIMRESLEDW
ncbi:MAG: LPS assembly lipoprotein LptE [Candidatus Cloacimonadales bacterium]